MNLNYTIWKTRGVSIIESSQPLILNCIYLLQFVNYVDYSLRYVCNVNIM